MSANAKTFTKEGLDDSLRNHKWHQNNKSVISNGKHFPYYRQCQDDERVWFVVSSLKLEKTD